MNESEKHEIQAIREDIAKRDKELKDMFLQLQESLKRSQRWSTRQTLYMLGLTTMVVGMTLTGIENIVRGLVLFGVGVALCLSIISPIFRVYRAVCLKFKLNKLSQHLFSDP